MNTPQPAGFLLVNKPTDITSHDVIDRLRKTTGIRKIGHAGTLDPFATGLLIVAVGRQATREIQSFVGLDKTYEAQIALGATTETLDTESEMIRDDAFTPPTESSIHAAMHALTGSLQQIPPMYAAIKVKGKKLYELAREGKTIERKPRPITVHQFALADIREENGLTIINATITCSSGTYIRSLARDLGTELGTTGYLTALHRSAIAHYTSQNAYDLDEIIHENWPTLLKKVVDGALT